MFQDKRKHVLTKKLIEVIGDKSNIAKRDNKMGALVLTHNLYLILSEQARSVTLIMFPQTQS